MIKDLTETRPDYYPARCPIVLCNKSQETEAFEQEGSPRALTEESIIQWSEKHAWCEFPVVQLNQWDVQSVEAGFQLLFSLGMQLQETWTERDEMKEIFGLVDADDGGSIDKEEFHELMGVVGMGHLSKDEADAMIDEVDARPPIQPEPERDIRT